MKCFFCSSVPAAMIAGACSMKFPMLSGTRARTSSSSKMYWSIRSALRPPYSSGQLIPIHPCSPILRISSLVNGPIPLPCISRSSVRNSGVTCSPMKSRISLRNFSFASVYPKSMPSSALQVDRGSRFGLARAARIDLGTALRICLPSLRTSPFSDRRGGAYKRPRRGGRTPRRRARSLRPQNTTNFVHTLKVELIWTRTGTASRSCAKPYASDCTATTTSVPIRRWTGSHQQRSVRRICAAHSPRRDIFHGDRTAYNLQPGPYPQPVQAR